MMTQGLHEKRVIDIVEEASDVELHNPVVLPTPLARHGNRVLG